MNRGRGNVSNSDLRLESIQEKSLVKFEGMLGRMVGLFGGKAAREGVVSTVALKGDRRMTVTEDTAQIVDLSEEKVYDVDMRKKTYRVTTFVELRRRMQEARARAEEDARKASKETSEQPPKNANEKEIASAVWFVAVADIKTIQIGFCHRAERDGFVSDRLPHA